ncbi:MAG: hypothetical protein ACFFBE_00470 [Promethearchaeota archaeon]
MVKFSINDYLELRLENGTTNIYVNNQLFIQCKHLLLQMSMEELMNLNNIKSIDEALEKLHGSHEYSKRNEIKIPSEIEFWGHCSNLQTWYENNYNPCLLHSNLAFPLLKKLTEAGDRLAKGIFKEEIAKRFDKGSLSNVQYLLYNNYLDFLEEIELESLFEQSSLCLIDNILIQLEKLIFSRFTNFRTIRELLDLILYIDLKFNKTLLIEISERFSIENKEQFIKVVLLHLNYKEFNNYNIPYGRFFIYFEHFITYLYENYPCVKDLLTFIDTGYYHSSYSLEEAFSYGTVLYK